MPKPRPYVGQITIAPRSPIKVRRGPKAHRLAVPARTKDLGRAAGKALKAYYRELKRLREGQFAAAVGTLPPHLTQSLRAYVISTNDIVFLREDLDPKLKRNKILVGSMRESPEAVAPMLSEKTLYLLTGDDWNPDPNDGVHIQLTKNDNVTLWKMRIGVAGRMPNTPSGDEPQPLVQMTRDIVIEVHGQALDEGNKPTHEFILRAALNLPVGWQRVTAFGPSRKSQWTRAFGKSLALRSITAAVFNQSIVDSALSQFDPMRGARNTYAAIINEFERHVSTCD